MATAHVPDNLVNKEIEESPVKESINAPVEEQDEDFIQVLDAKSKEQIVTTSLDDSQSGDAIVDIYDYDIIIVGAGISGINMAYRVQTMLKDKTYVILERREQMGGTWDLMKYPGIRSDSDLYTFGFPWRPWTHASPIAEGPLIKKYIEGCAVAEGIDTQIKYKHTLLSADWRSSEQQWTLTVEDGSAGHDGAKRRKCFRGNFLVLGTGYYDYDTPLQTVIPGLDQFKGEVIHPQFWPEGYDYSEKNIAVIGSGATAITIIPAMASKAKLVTMVQRSPTYIMSMPNGPSKPAWMRLLPTAWQNKLVRVLYLLIGYVARWFLSSDTARTRNFLMKETKKQLPEHVAYDPHFKPKYAPWTQRMCVCPDGDFFKSLHTKKAAVETGEIDTCQSDGILMKSGNKVSADIIITATGLNMVYGGKAVYTIDGQTLEVGSKYLWRGIMLQDVPNCAIVMGYTKASWTLGADATAHMVVRMIKHLDLHGYGAATPTRTPEDAAANTSNAASVMGLSSTYILAALDRLPKTSSVAPWKQRTNYLRDIWDAKHADVGKGMRFTKKI